MSGRNWKEEITEQWGIEVINDSVAVPRHVLWTTRCSRTKEDRQRGLPEEMYVSALNRYFYRYVKSHGLRFGVLSDKYGLHLDTERLAYYDVHPRDLSATQKMLLGRLIARKASAKGFSTILFYNSSPLMSKPYFEMLAHSGLRILYMTRLPRTEN